MQSESLHEAAKVNMLDNFKYVFDRLLEGLLIDRMEGNEDIFGKIMNDAAFRKVAAAHLVREVYEKIRAKSER